jgi:PAS domain S-box-containing protein
MKKSASEISWQELVNTNDLILQSLSEGVCVINQSRQIVFANNSALRLLDCELTNLLKKKYDLAFFQRDKSLSEEDLATCPIQFALTEGATSRIEADNFFRSDGSDFLVEYVCTPILENGEIIGAVVIFQDITEKREVEMAIRQARDAALEAARMKAAFLANISHEIRTPLSGIVGIAALLSETNLSVEQRNLVEMLQQSANLLMSTVNEILDYSKIEAGKLKSEAVEFNLRKIIRETIALFKSAIEKKGLNFDFSVESEIGENFWGDPNFLRQVLSNLLANAVKFTEAGKIQLRVSKFEENENTVVVIFEVSDTGIGISKSEKAKLFQPFMQADISAKRRFGGTGLGLAICKELVALMQGEIGVESEPGEGSQFWFKIPLTKVTKFSKPKVLYAENFENLPSETGNLQVLVAEDNKINREIILKILKQLDCSAEVAENGLEAIEISTKKSFDLILMDCQMPETDGYEAARKIRQTGKNADDVKIVALSANAEELERERCLQAGMDDFLCKPLTKESLGKILRKYFSGEKAFSNLDLEKKIIHHSLSKIITTEVLESFLEIESRGEKNFIFEIFQIYFETAEKDFQELETAWRKRDFESARKTAHRLKGSSMNVGLSKLAKILETLENLPDHEQAENLTATAKQEFETIKRKILESLNYEN